MMSHSSPKKTGESGANSTAPNFKSPTGKSTSKQSPKSAGKRKCRGSNKASDGTNDIQNTNTTSTKPYTSLLPVKHNNPNREKASWIETKTYKNLGSARNNQILKLNCMVRNCKLLEM